LLLALALAAQGSVEASPALWMSALAALAAAWRFVPEKTPPPGFTPLAVSACAFVLWIVVTNLWANPSYTAAAPNHAAFLLGGLLLGRRAGAENAGLLFGAALVFALGLAAWAIWQRIGQGAPRAYALFETPATLSSTINLVLLPGLVLLAVGRRSAVLAVALVALSAGLAAAASRGGWLGLAAGGVIAMLLAHRAGPRIDWKSAATAFAIPALGWLLVTISTQGPQHPMTGSLDLDSGLARLDLYELALKGIAASPLVIGSGYLAFYYLLEPARETITGYGESITYFVHNDYLQPLLELGIPGLAGLLALIALPQAQAWRAVPALGSDQKLIVVALAAALGSMAIHALIDFPFYVPVCLLIYGAAAGLLDSLTAAGVGGRLPRVLVVAAATLGFWILATPVASQAAAGYAHRQWQAAHGESAAYWYEVARRIEPRDWRYHWYAGQFWYAQAQASKNHEAARLADDAFAAGFAANPREVRNLLGRISTHLRLRALLAAPADNATLREWADHALALAPLDPAVKAERNLVLKQHDALRGTRPR
jgi:O-antigen ligase